LNQEKSDKTPLWEGVASSYLRNIIKQPEVLTTIQLSANQAGVDKLNDKEIDAEISGYRRSISKK